MIIPLPPLVDFPKQFDRSLLPSLQPYFDIDLDSNDEQERIQWFHNLKALAEYDLSLAHSVQHSATAKVAVHAGRCSLAKDRVLSAPFNDIIGCVANLKRSDTLQLVDGRLSGQKNWISNLDVADYCVINVGVDGQSSLIYIDLSSSAHRIIDDHYTPLGMESTRPYSLAFDGLEIPSDHVLGISGTQELFAQSNFASYCFITNHLGLTRALFREIKAYAEKNRCGADHDLKKIEMDICGLELIWQSKLPTVMETTLTHSFWNERNTQYAVSKKTLIGLVQLILELGVSYYTDAKSEFSQRFRDALTYVSHMHALYRFGQEFFMLDLFNERPQ